MAKLNGYWEWAQSDPLIAGLNCWHWTTITGLYKRAPGIIPFYYGVDHMPKVVARLNEIGAIIQKQQSTPSSRNHHPIKSDDSDATDAHDDGTGGGDSVTFGTPHLLGQANFSEPGFTGPNQSGTRFWYPSYSIATSRSTNGQADVAQHVTLANDGGPCNDPRTGAEQTQFCEEIWITRDGGTSYTLVKKVAHGTSGNFNGYGG